MKCNLQITINSVTNTLAYIQNYTPKYVPGRCLTVSDLSQLSAWLECQNQARSLRQNAHLAIHIALLLVTKLILHNDRFWFLTPAAVAWLAQEKSSQIGELLDPFSSCQLKGMIETLHLEAALPIDRVAFYQQQLVRLQNQPPFDPFPATWHFISEAEWHLCLPPSLDPSTRFHLLQNGDWLPENPLECGLNEYLHKQGIEVVDTDLGERIVQLANEPPSHIVLPCIHWKKEEIGELFHQHLGTPKGNADPQFLTAAARAHLREHFLTSRVALTGVNFAVAETGEFIVGTNEGNAALGVHLADVPLACMGIEKIIPKRKHLSVFLRLLARSATGQPITTYSSQFQKPREGQEMHIVLVDNGRSERLANNDFRNALKCIRCGACFNTCPVYRRSGGHSYHTAVAGPIGSILGPGFDMAKNADLPFASTLCGSCTNVCPVKIDIHDQLFIL